MKKLVLMVALLTLVAFTSGVLAQPKPAPAPAPSAPAPAAPAPEKAKTEKPKAEKPMRFTGTVEKVDEMAKAIVVKGKVKGKEESMTFATDDKTKIAKGKETISLAEIKSGMHVSVAYKKDGDKMMATVIMVSAPKAAPKKEKPAEAPKEAPKK